MRSGMVGKGLHTRTAVRTGGMILLALVLALTLTQALAAAAAPVPVFPEVIPLPDGFKPEGVAVGRGTDFYAGSLLDGAIYKGDLRTGAGDVLVPGSAGELAAGLAVDARSNHVFAAGSFTGKGYVYDGSSGETVQVYQLATSSTFVNDVIVTRSAAYFTDSFRPYIYRVPLGPRGELPDPSAVEEIALGGDFVFVPGPFVFNANGIDATPDGKALVIVNSATGTLYRVDVGTWEVTEIDLGGEVVANGDGILLDGTTLYVVQNALYQIAVVALAPDLSAGSIVGTITDDDFGFPTTVAEFGAHLYAVNAHFDIAPPTAPAPGVAFEIVRVPKH